MAELLRVYGLNMESDSLQLSGLLTVDSTTGQFTGEGADAANAYLKRTYLAPFALPAVASARNTG